MANSTADPNAAFYGNQVAQSAPGDNLDQLRALLVKAITDHIAGPEPSAPRYQPRPATGGHALAMVRNPQMAAGLEQRYQAGPMAQYDQAQQAFEQAIRGRQTAMGAGVQMLGQEQRQQISPLDIAKFREEQRHNKAMEALTGKRLAQGTPAPASIGSEISRDISTLGGLAALRKSYDEIRKTTKGQTFAGQVVRNTIGESRYGGALQPDYAKYIADRSAALNAYIKSVTGAQFGFKEMQRYQNQFPEPWDPEDLAQRKIDALARNALSDMQTIPRLYPGAGAATQEGAPKDRAEALVDEILAGH
jgi:hypothetical protein